MKTILFTNPIFKERIWGGTDLKEIFGYDIPSANTGECWAVSAHPQGTTAVHYNNSVISLQQLWETRRELFGGIKGDKFPLLTKILHAAEDLSVQVHPNDDFAQENENGELGKTECWYVIHCQEDSHIIIGHTAKDKHELEQLINNSQWDKLLRKMPIKPGDFIYVPSGTVHAICKGTVILETQQNSDTTYRLYDYDRKDSEGNKRELHLQKSLQVITTPHSEIQNTPEIKIFEGGTISTYIQNEFFCVYKYDVSKKITISQDYPFLIMSVISGNGYIDGKEIYKGNHFILPHGYGDFTLEGNMEIIASHI